MQPTARRFELRTSRLVDDRKNLRHATRAALDYLQKLHAQFGDWHLAMAAYNWGEGRVQRAVNRQRARGEVVDFNALAPRMPVETRHYVPQIMALARLVAHPQALGVRLPDIPDRNPLVEAELAHDTDLALVLRFAGMAQAEFLALNPAVKPPLVLAAATPRLLMPEPAARRFTAAQAAHEGRTASFKVVRLQRTQPVESIARAFGATAADVRAFNDIPRGTKPVLGSVLLLPAAVPEGTRAGAALVADAQLTTVADVVRLQVPARKGETPQRLARRCGVNAASLAGWNRLSRQQMRRPLPAGRTWTLWVQREAPGACARVGPPRSQQLS
jgi:membrane-bound lytic murein transglycosylase D